MEIIKTEKKPIFNWVSNIELGALEQAKNLANLPFVHNHVALMPDCHEGYGMPIGGVLATRDVVIPNAVGVDIGCGMHAVKLNLYKEELTREKLIEIMKHIRENIPVGFNHRKEPVDKNKMPQNPDSNILSVPEFISSQEYESARKQLGTLGGGNHFIEIQYDTKVNKDGKHDVWFMIHSGSRNIGLKVAKHYNDLAIELNQKYFSEVKKDKDLAFLPVDTNEAQNYLLELNYCLEFARANRQYMADVIKEGFENIYPKPYMYGPVEEYDVHHNYVIKEHHFGKDVWVHRKGATSAKEGEIGIIPGSQGTASYIVRGLGNHLSFNSCSHGAGRKMGRREAQRQLNLEKEQQKLNDQGIMHSIRNKNDLDEASGAYKDIDEVMKNQNDLVQIVTELKPIAVIKG